jgi:hypothetical protein
MSTDNVKSKKSTRDSVTWNSLIMESESQIAICRKKIRDLSKSLRFFKKQESSGVPFPPSSGVGGREKQRKYHNTSCN